MLDWFGFWKRDFWKRSRQRLIESVAARMYAQGVDRGWQLRDAAEASLRERYIQLGEDRERRRLELLYERKQEALLSSAKGTVNGVVLERGREQLRQKLLDAQRSGNQEEMLRLIAQQEVINELIEVCQQEGPIPS